MRTIRTQIATAHLAGANASTVRVLHRDMEMAEEAMRLGEFTRECYGAATLTQEQLSESLKRMRDRLLRRGWGHTVARMLPRPLGARVVHVGVPEPIRVARVKPAERASYEDALLELTRASMQDRLDEINRDIEPDLVAFRHPNPFIGTVR
jgi:hypothetical protein